MKTRKYHYVFIVYCEKPFWLIGTYPTRRMAIAECANKNYLHPNLDAKWAKIRKYENE